MLHVACLHVGASYISSQDVTGWTRGGERRDLERRGAAHAGTNEAACAGRDMTHSHCSLHTANPMMGPHEFI